MSQRLQFELTIGMVTTDGYDVEMKGHFIGGDESQVKTALLAFAKNNSLDTLLTLVERDTIHDLLGNKNITELKLVTVSALQSDTVRYAINPDLEGKKRKKGFFSRFKRD